MRLPSFFRRLVQYLAIAVGLDTGFGACIGADIIGKNPNDGYLNYIKKQIFVARLCRATKICFFVKSHNPDR